MSKVIPFPLAARRGELVVTQLAPDKFCVDHCTLHADSIAILVNNIPTYIEARATARRISDKTGIRYDEPEERPEIDAIMGHARQQTGPVPPDEGGTAA